jgi:hypothetical protein
MPNALRSQIHDLAVTFATHVLSAIRGASLEDILTESQGGGSASSPVKRGPGRPPKSAARGGTTAANPTLATKTKGGRLVRRSPSDIAKALASIVGLLKKKPGLRSEAIRAALKMDRKEMPRVIAEGLSKKVLVKKGEKRATTYRTV